MKTIPMDLVIDGDTHIEEHPAIWDYMDKEYAPRRPVPVKIDTIPDRPERDVQWFVDGAVFPRMMGHGQSCYGSPVLMKFSMSKPISMEAQSVLTAEARIAEMDKQGVDVQVIYPTLFLQWLTKDLPYEAALMRSYNDYLADRFVASGGRLRWIAPVPIRDVPAAIQEMRRVHAKGASGAFLLGTAGNQFLHDRIFDPFWEAAEDLQMPVCCHVGWTHTALLDSCDNPVAGLFMGIDLGLVMGLFSFLAGGIFDRFPHLKVGMIEGGFDWFQTAIKRLSHWHKSPASHPWPAKHEPMYYIANRQLYFGAEGDEDDLPHLLEVFGEDRIFAGQDFPHAHYKNLESGESVLSYSFDELMERTDVSDVAKRKLMCDNAMKFYGIKAKEVQRAPRPAAAAGAER